MNRKSALKISLLFAFGSLLSFGYTNCGQMRDSGANITSSKGTEVLNPFTSSVAAFPQVHLTSTYPVLPTPHNVLTVGTGKTYSDCQAAVDAAVDGDEVVIDSGFTCSPFILRNKGQLTYAIVIRPSNYSSLPPDGTRVSRADAGNMAIVESPGTTIPIKAELQANGYYLTGLEVRENTSATTSLDSLISFGAGNSVTSTTMLAHDNVVARCWVHGTLTQSIARGVDLNGSRLSVVDSVIEEIHARPTVSGATLGEAIAAWNAATGPFKIRNNELLSAGDNVSVGAFVTNIQNLIPDDIEVTNNWFHKNSQWQTSVTDNTGVAGPWQLDAFVRLQNAQRVLISGNTMENIWTSNYSGSYPYAFIIFPSSFVPPGTTTVSWARVQDVNIHNNVIHDVPGLFNISFQDSTNASVVAQRLDIENNVAYALQDQVTTSKASSLIVVSGTATSPTVFNHNTFLTTSAPQIPYLRALGGASVPQFTFTNNIVYTPYTWPIYDSTSVLASQVLSETFPGVVFGGNVLVAENSSRYGTYAIGNFFASSQSTVGFTVDPTGGVADYGNLGLSPTSPYASGATDGFDPGFLLSFF